ncbi:MAG: hypothetical protein IK059_02100 [Firmicutes bacterium]|nr:hypothetical protein [Bacillota bacterium]
MSLFWRDSSGTESQVAGLAMSGGELVMGASTIRTGTVTIPVTKYESTGGFNTVVTFTDPMSDANYSVALDRVSKLSDNSEYLHR